MDFENLTEIILSENDQRIKILQINKICIDKGVRLYVVIKSFWKDDDKLVPSNNKICLRRKDFEDLLRELEHNKFEWRMLTRPNRKIVIKKDKIGFNISLSSSQGYNQNVWLYANEVTEILSFKELILNSLCL